ncbi:hypothetical protein D3C85_1181450 [compost metagenome]
MVASPSEFSKRSKILSCLSSFTMSLFVVGTDNVCVFSLIVTGSEAESVTVDVIGICLISASFRSPLYKPISRCFSKSSDNICFRSLAIPSTPSLCV